MRATRDRKLIGGIAGEAGAFGRLKLEHIEGVVVEIGSGAFAGQARIRRVGLEATDVGRPFYKVVGEMPLVNDTVTALTNYAGGVIINPAPAPEVEIEAPTHFYSTPAADQTKTSDVALSDATDLLVPLAASETWAFEFSLFVTGPTAGDVQFALTIPTGATLRSSGFGPDVALTALPVAIQQVGNINASAGILVFATTGTAVANQVLVSLKGYIQNGVTPGDLQLQFAQNTSSATVTTLRSSSYVIANKLG